MEASIADHWFLPPFLAGFVTIYAIGYLLVFRGWSSKLRPDAASCLISLAHGTPAVILALSALAAAPRSFEAPNAALQNLTLDYSVAYFITDLLHLLLFTPGDVLFILHHLATLYVFVTCRYVAYHGAYGLLVLLVLAEVTSACQNVWSLTGLRKADSPAAAEVHKLLSPPFYAFYTVMRAVLGPIFFFQMSTYYLSGKVQGAIPQWMCISWIVVIGAAIAVSISWVSNNWMALFRGRQEGTAKKES